MISWKVDLLGVDLAGIDFMRVDLMGLTLVGYNSKRGGAVIQIHIIMLFFISLTGQTLSESLACENCEN